jgi:hypothetical protein
MDCVNPEHAGELRDGCRGCARDREAELTALNDRYMRLLHDRSDDDRRARAAARREAQDHMRAFAGPVLAEMWREAGDVAEVSHVVGRATVIDPDWGRSKAARDQLATLKVLAERAQRGWYARLRRVAEQFAADPRETEIVRLRDLITARGQLLHREPAVVPVPVPPGWACCCAGCELIRAMDAGVLDMAAGGTV